MKRKIFKLSLLFILSLGILIGCSNNTVDNETKENVEVVENNQDIEESEKTKQEEVQVEEEQDGESGPTKVEVIRLAGGDAGMPGPYTHYPRGPGIFKYELVFDSLCEKDEVEIIPWMVDSWEVSEDGKDITYELKKGLKWHDGEDVTSEDVAFTFDYFDKHVPVRDHIHEGGESIIDSVEIIDEHKFIVHLKRFSNTYFGKIGETRIIPKHIWENVEDPLSFDEPEAMIGSGPYIVDSYSPEQGSYRFVKFDDYIIANQSTDAIEWIPVSDEILAFEQNEIDFIRIAPDMISRYEDNSDINVLILHSHHAYRLMLNGDKVEETKDKDVRHAIAYAINREALIEKVERGVGEIGNPGYMIPDHSFYNPDVEKYEYNPEKAKELLKGRTIKYDLLVSNNPQEIKIAELVKLDLEKVGFEIEVKAVERKTRDSDVRDNNYEMAIIMYGGMGGDPDILRNLYSSKSKGALAPWYSNEELDEILDAQLIEVDPEVRKELIFEAQEIIADEIPMIPLYATFDINVYRPGVYDGWMTRFDHNKPMHPKLSFIER